MTYVNYIVIIKRIFKCVIMRLSNIEVKLGKVKRC